MNQPTADTIHKITHYTLETLPNLLSLEDAAAKVGVAPARLQDFCDGLLCPHYRIDNGPPLFKISEIREWVARNLVQRCEGAELPYRISIGPQVRPPGWTTTPPDCLLPMVRTLREAETGAAVSGVYFLCLGDEVIYIGQSVNVLMRLASHFEVKEFDRAYWISVSPDRLNEVEGTLIRHLAPRLNGKSPGGRPVGPVPIAPERLLEDFGFLQAAAGSPELAGLRTPEKFAQGDVSA